MQYFKGRSLEDYLGFIRPSAKMKCLFFLTQSIAKNDMAFSKNAVEQLAYSDHKRREAQIRMGKINDHIAQTCIDCKGLCCQGSYDHYSSIDYIMRLHGTCPIPSYGCEDEKTIKRIFVIKDRMKRILNSKDVLFTGQNRLGCPMLGPCGCKAKVDQRPIKCLTFTCVRMRNAMTRNMKREYAESIQELVKQCGNVFDIVKNETKTPRHFGSIQIVTTL